MTKVKLKDEVEAMWEINYLNRLENERAKWTPDHLTLAQYASQYLFVVDNLKKTQHKHWFIKDVAEKKAEAYTVDQFTSHNYNLGHETYSIPLEYSGEKQILQPNSKMYAPPSIISGELFLVSDHKVIESLDKLKMNGVKFIRKRVEIQIPYRKTKWVKDINKIPPELIPIDPGRATTGWFTHKMKAWMYVGVKDHWESLFDNGFYFSPTPLAKPNSGWTEHYYLFNNK